MSFFVAASWLLNSEYGYYILLIIFQILNGKGYGCTVREKDPERVRVRVRVWWIFQEGGFLEPKNVTFFTCDSFLSIDT